MSEPIWLAREDVEAIHEQMIEIGGGAHGLRDPALLESAMARPQNLHAYGEDDTFQLAASYAEGIARNHPFVDGNKRTAFATADVFLAENGHNLDQAKGLEHAEMMEKLGQGQITREDAADHLREHSRPLQRQREQEQIDLEPKRPRFAEKAEQALGSEAIEQAREDQRQAQQHEQKHERDRKI